MLGLVVRDAQNALLTMRKTLRLPAIALIPRSAADTVPRACRPLANP
jgi:hypothetical protein